MKKTISFLILSSLTFSACASTAEPPPQQVAPPAETVTTTPETLPAAPADTGDPAFFAAVESLDISNCDSLTTSLAGECRTKIQDTLLTNTALKTLNLSVCDQINSSLDQENCVKKVTAAIEHQENPPQDPDEVVAILEESANSQNLAVCDQLDDENQKYSCRYNIVANQALAANDPATCDNIGHPDFVAQCRLFFETAPEAPPAP